MYGELTVTVRLKTNTDQYQKDMLENYRANFQNSCNLNIAILYAGTIRISKQTPSPTINLPSFGTHSWREYVDFNDEKPLCGPLS